MLESQTEEAYSNVGRTHISPVSLFFDLRRTFPQVPTEKAQRAVSPLCDVVNVGFPAQITLNCYAQVLCIINSAKS